MKNDENLENPPSELRSCLFTGCVSVSTLFVIFVVGLIIFSHVSHHLYMKGWEKNRLPFDQAKWLKNPETRELNPPRLRMVDDLLASKKFTGWTKEQVQDLLGPPTKTSYFYNYELVYWLGPERSSFGLDSEWLAFDIGEDGKVKDCCLLRD